MYQQVDYNDPRLSIYNVMNKCNIKVLNTKGSEDQCICPFCDDNSGHLFVNVNKNMFKCMRCGTTGTAVSMYAKLNNLSTKDAFKALITDSDTDIEQLNKKVKKEIHKKNVVYNEADIQTKDKVYNAFLNLLMLNDQHFENLLTRGLCFDEIRKNQYKSLVPSNNARRLICKKLLDKGYTLEGVPGFYVDETEEWNFMHINTGGIIIPSRDIDNRIQGMQIRLDGAVKRKYRNFTSVDLLKGTPTHNYVHVRHSKLGASYKAQRKVVVTEGVLKSDVASYLSDTTFVGIVGVNTLNGLADVLKDLNATNLYTAFDMDKSQNEYVMQAEKNLIEYLRSYNFDPQISTWNKEYKGIDDYLYYINQKKQDLNKRAV